MRAVRNQSYYETRGQSNVGIGFLFSVPAIFRRLKRSLFQATVMPKWVGLFVWIGMTVSGIGLFYVNPTAMYRFPQIKVARSSEMDLFDGKGVFGKYSLICDVTWRRACEGVTRRVFT